MKDVSKKDKNIGKLILEWMVIVLIKKNSRSNAFSVLDQKKIGSIQRELKEIPREVLRSYLSRANLVAAEEDIVEFLEEITGERIYGRQLLIEIGLLVTKDQRERT